MSAPKKDQLLLVLRKARLRTTERYQDIEQDLTDAPCDRLSL